MQCWGRVRKASMGHSLSLYHKSAKIECSHSISGYNVILWYKQSNNRELMLLGYMVGTSAIPEAGFDIEGDASAGGTSTLTIKQLTPNSSAVYYCAASLHSASDLPLCSTKTSFPGVL
uniref:Immunoglobulin V-set domain-containing protein n=1 Tax=Oncorhynchus tshawytscha TaxID=74940 RepID=A0AAZ3ST76_ONCTS